MRLENQAYLLKQMQERDSRKDDDKYLTDIQVIDRRERSVAYQKEIIKQMEWKAAQREIEMSDTEVALNKPLLDLVDRTLEQRDQNMQLVAHME